MSAFWPLADMLLALTNVRFLGKVDIFVGKANIVKRSGWAPAVQ
jgi:hypothetical protein